MTIRDSFEKHEEKARTNAVNSWGLEILLGPKEGLGTVAAFFAEADLSGISLSVAFLAGVAGMTLRGWAVDVEVIEVVGKDFIINGWKQGKPAGPGLANFQRRPNISEVAHFVNKYIRKTSIQISWDVYLS